MKISVLIEDTCGNPSCTYEHGLSVYIETNKHKLLADTGATSAFIKNATVLGINLSEIDTVILSHGHYDHSGGILAFSELNPNAPIYMQHTAIEDYYHNERYIGIDKRILTLPQVHLLKGDYEIDEELYVFAGITGRRFYPQSNLALSKHINGKNEPDSFTHEQCLVIREENETVLVSGCAHNGILNMIDRYRQIFGNVPDKVISGFHMAKKTPYNEEEIQLIQDTAKELKKQKTVFYTGHCTGEEAIKLMKPIMGDQLIPFYSGTQISAI